MNMDDPSRSIDAYCAAGGFDELGSREASPLVGCRFRLEILRALAGELSSRLNHGRDEDESCQCGFDCDVSELREVLCQFPIDEDVLAYSIEGFKRILRTLSSRALGVMPSRDLSELNPVSLTGGPGDGLSDLIHLDVSVKSRSAHMHFYIDTDYWREERLASKREHLTVLAEQGYHLRPEVVQIISLDNGSITDLFPKPRQPKPEPVFGDLEASLLFSNPWLN